MLSRDDALFLQSAISSYQHLDEKEREFLAANMNAVTYRPGSILDGNDKENSGFMIIKQGALRVYLLSKEGREITLYRLRGGDVSILAAMASVDHVYFNMQIEVEQKSEVLYLGARYFWQIVRNNIHVEADIYKLGNHRLASSIRAVERVLFFNIEQRVALFLLDEQERLESNMIPMTHDQIARYIGTTREVVTRALNNMANEGVVALSRGRIEILDTGYLKQLLE